MLSVWCDPNQKFISPPGSDSFQSRLMFYCRCFISPPANNSFSFTANVLHFFYSNARSLVSWTLWNWQKCPEIVRKFCKHFVLKFHFLLLGALKCQNYELLKHRTSEFLVCAWTSWQCLLYELLLEYFCIQLAWLQSGLCRQILFLYWHHWF